MVKDRGETELVEGRVLRAASGRFLVGDGEQVIPCHLRGRIKKERQRRVRNVVPGDLVLVRLTGALPRPESEGVIEEVLPRSSQLSRTSPGGRREQVLMANPERIFVVMATREPAFNARLLDRFLVAIENQNLEAVICLNKCDLASPAERVSMISPYRAAGYPALMLSALTGEGVPRLADAMAGRLSLFLGPSGSGKSSLLQRIQPGLEIATRAVSGASGKGRHTTSVTELHPLDRGGYVADSPGVREFGLWGLDERDLAGCFPEFRPHLGTCRFPDCTHSHEPDCGLRRAAEERAFDPRRYESYLRILESLREGDLAL